MESFNRILEMVFVWEDSICFEDGYFFIFKVGRNVVGIRVVGVGSGFICGVWGWGRGCCRCKRFVIVFLNLLC